jgi:hypothetical protein
LLGASINIERKHFIGSTFAPSGFVIFVRTKKPLLKGEKVFTWNNDSVIG